MNTGVTQMQNRQNVRPTYVVQRITAIHYGTLASIALTLWCTKRKAVYTCVDAEWTAVRIQ